VARDPYGDGIEQLARLLRRRFGRTPGRSFVVLVAELHGIAAADQETQRLPLLRSA
jgi:hypothetical protein